jgi:membrane-bound lytic murein transglycosylase B
MKRLALALAFLSVLCHAADAAAPRSLDLQRDDVRAFVEQVHREHGLSQESVLAVLARARLQPGIVSALDRPAERVKPWHEYRKIWMTEERIAAGVNFWLEHRERIDRIAAETGVPGEILVGIIGVETYYGRIIGRHQVLDALATQAFDYPRRQAFGTRQLAEFLLLTQEQGLQAETLTGSYAGAMGLPQFIPSSYRAYAVDGDGDGRIDLWGSIDDVLASVANYFLAHRWRPGEPVVAPAVTGNADAAALASQDHRAPNTTTGALWAAGIGMAGPAPASRDAAAGLFALEHEDGTRYWTGFHNFYVITKYNHSLMYALAVHQLGDAIKDRMPAARDAG